MRRQKRARIHFMRRLLTFFQFLQSFPSHSITSHIILNTIPVTRCASGGTNTVCQDTQLAALHLVSERARPKLRILCLHGYLQNSQVGSVRFGGQLNTLADLTTYAYERVESVWATSGPRMGSETPPGYIFSCPV